jgi:hypothetical protein
MASRGLFFAFSVRSIFARFIERCHFFVCHEFEIFSEPLRGVSVTASMLSEARI